MAHFSRKAVSSLSQPIGRLMAQALKYPEIISLAAGFVDPVTLPVEEVRSCLARLTSDASSLRRALQYDSTAGSALLRETLAQWSYREFPAARPAVERIILGAGSNQLLHLVAEALLEPGDIVLAAAPTYFVYLGTLKALGVRVMGVRADQDGMDIHALEDRLQQLAKAGLADRVRAIYLVPDLDNPAGSTLTLARRQQLLNVVDRWRRQFGPVVIISDNAYRSLSGQQEPIPPLLTLSPAAADYVLELGTFSKSFSPGIRVGWGVFPEKICEHLLSLKASIDFGSPHFDQLLIHQVILSGAWDTHIAQVAAGYQHKLRIALSALDRCLGDRSDVAWRRPSGGMYVWISLPESIDAGERGRLWAAATARGVLYVPGHYCYPEEGEPVRHNTLRLSFGAVAEGQLERGIERLSEAIEAVLDSRDTGSASGSAEQAAGRWPAEQDREKI